MYYVITKDNIYKFKAMKDMKDCDIIVPGSVVYNGDAKRIAHFANLGEDVELPTSLSRKTSDGYIREKKLAREFVKHLT